MNDQHDTPNAEPVGQGFYQVRVGDSIASIAFKHGFFPDTIWHHTDNTELKKARQNPETLLAGDRVTIPEKQPKTETKAARQRHRFRRKGVPRRLRLRFWDGNEQPLADKPLRIDVDGHLGEGRTDAEGWFQHPIAPDARTAKVVVDETHFFRFRLGHLSPIGTVQGVQERLTNLGFYQGPADGSISDQFASAVALFQASRGLEVSAEIDDATISELLKLHSV